MHGREAPRRCRCAAAAAKNILRVPKAGVGGSSSENDINRFGISARFDDYYLLRQSSSASALGSQLRRTSPTASALIRRAGISLAAAARVVL